MNFLWQEKPFAGKLAHDWQEGLRACAPGGNWDGYWREVPSDEPLGRGPVVMYGIQPKHFPHWLKLRLEGRDFYYIDNAYLSPGHADDRYVRITKNALQCSGYGTSDLKRLAAHEIDIKDWIDPSLGEQVNLTTGESRLRNILITCQSGWWYIQHGTTLQAWLDRVIAEIRESTDRPIKVRLKPKAKYLHEPNTLLEVDWGEPNSVPFEEDLAEAFCIVTHSSNTAVEAILAGVPAFVLGQSAAQPFAGNDLKMIEAPLTGYGDRWNWAGVLADNQWTPKEIREGKAWSDLNA